MVDDIACYKILQHINLLSSYLLSIIYLSCYMSALSEVPDVLNPNKLLNSI